MDKIKITCCAQDFYRNAYHSNLGQCWQKKIIPTFNFLVYFLDYFTQYFLLMDYDQSYTID